MCSRHDDGTADEQQLPAETAMLLRIGGKPESLFRLVSRVGRKVSER